MGRGICERTERDHGGLEQSKTGQWGESGRRKQKKGLFCFVLFLTYVFQSSQLSTLFAEGAHLKFRKVQCMS